MEQTKNIFKLILGIVAGVVFSFSFFFVLVYIFSQASIVQSALCILLTLVFTFMYRNRERFFAIGLGCSLLLSIPMFWIMLSIINGCWINC